MWTHLSCLELKKNESESQMEKIKEYKLIAEFQANSCFVNELS